MSIKIIRPGEAIPVHNLRITWYGDTNVGKTTLALSTSRPLLLDFDTGAHRAIQGTTATIVRVENWDDVRQLMNDTAFLAQFDTIILDTVSKCLDYMTADIIKYDPQNGKGGALSQKGWGKLGTMFSAFTHQLVALRKDLVMLGQASEKERDDSTQVRIKAQGQAKGLIMENSDFVAYLHSKGNKRIISYTFNDDFYAKDVKGIMGAREMPDPDKSPTFGAEMITQMKTAFASAAAIEAEKVQVLQTWTDTIEGFTTADEFNAILGDLTTMKLNNAALYQQVGGLVRQRREQLGIEYDAEKQMFKRNGKAKAQGPTAVQPAPVAPPVPTPAPAPTPTPAPQAAVEMEF